MEGGRSSDLDRRALIRRAAVGGVLAWTAPVVLGSLGTPAGALTGGNCVLGIWSVYSPNPNGRPCTTSLVPCTLPTLSPDPGCAEVTVMSSPGDPSPPGLSISSCQTSGSQTVATFSVASGCSITGYHIGSAACAGSITLTAHSGTSLTVQFSKDSTRYVYVLADCS